MFHCSRVSKNFTILRGISVFSIENLLSHSAEYFRRGSFTVAKISGIEKVWLRVGGGGRSKFSVEIFLSHSAENFRRGTLLRRVLEKFQ